MREMSFHITTTNNSITAASPTRMKASRVRVEKALPFTVSATLIRICPPSSSGIGSRLRIAMLMLRNASRASSDCSPPVLAASTLLCAIAIGPPSCRTLTRPSTSPLSTLSTAPPIASVPFHPSTVACAKPIGSRWIACLGAAPILPTVFASPVASSVPGVGSGVTARLIRAVPRATSIMIGCPGDADTLSTNSAQSRTGAPETAMMLSPARKPAAAAGLPGRISLSTGETYGRPYTANNAIETTMVSAKFMATPESMMNTRAGRRLLSNQRSAGTAPGPNGASAWAS